MGCNQMHPKRWKLRRKSKKNTGKTGGGRDEPGGRRGTGTLAAGKHAHHRSSRGPKRLGSAEHCDAEVEVRRGSGDEVVATNWI
jgi:hypothetical protein